jgi:16S rRNA (guanine527-N7)-methyltransferase
MTADPPGRMSNDSHRRPETNAGPGGSDIATRSGAPVPSDTLTPSTAAQPSHDPKTAYSGDRAKTPSAAEPPPGSVAQRRSAGSRPLAAAIARLLQTRALSQDLAPRFHGLVDLLAGSDAPTAVRDPRAVVDVHVADSLIALDVPEVRQARRIADLGSGAGLPGLALALAQPAAQVTLVESQRRKCDFLERAISALSLTNAAVVCARAEELGADAAFDVVTARALASLPVLCEYAAPLLEQGGVLVAWKGAVDPAEEGDGLAAAAALGLARATVWRVEPYDGSERRTLHIFRKVAPTPPGYPRRPGMAVKRPLRTRVAS